MKNLIRTHGFIMVLFLGSFLAPSAAQAGPLKPVCLAACLVTCSKTACAAALVAVAATVATAGAGAPVALAAGTGCALCKAGCVIGCAFSCFSQGTQITLLEHGVSTKKNIESIEVGDTILTLVDKKPTWTKVLRNLKSEGEFPFVEITAQNAKNGSQKTIKVTPEHGLVFSHDNGDMTIDSAQHVQLGDRVIDADGNTLIVINVAHLTLSEKYTLETLDGTVLASDLFMTTLCNEEVSGGERLFGTTINDWQQRHNFSNIP